MKILPIHLLLCYQFNIGFLHATDSCYKTYLLQKQNFI